MNDDDFDHESLGPPLDAVTSHRDSVRSVQVTLSEMFFLTTLTAVAIGIYVYVSPLLAMTIGGGLIVAGVVKWSGTHNMILGGLLGFATAATMVAFIAIYLQTDVGTTVVLALLCPAAGYIGGCCLCELSNNDF